MATPQENKEKKVVKKKVKKNVVQGQCDHHFYRYEW
jgi:hypothetical protein